LSTDELETSMGSRWVRVHDVGMVISDLLERLWRFVTPREVTNRWLGFIWFVAILWGMSAENRLIITLTDDTVGVA